MTISKFPEITLTCRNGHQIKTRARAGQSIKCQACGVFKKVPAARPRTARELSTTLAAPGDDDQDQGAEMADRWENEPEWDGQPRLLPGRAGDQCPECSGPLMWEPGRTRTFCGTCQRAALPAAVVGHYERQAKKQAEVAVRTAPDESASRTARAQLRARKEMTRKNTESWLETVADDDSYDRMQWRAQAAELAALLRGYLPEIDQAPDRAALEAVRREIHDLLTGELGMALASEYEAAQARIYQQHEARQQAIEYEREQQESEAQAERAARQAEIKQARERKAITSGQPTATLPGSTLTTGRYGPIIMTIANIQRRKEREIKAKGECEFGHRGQTVASRIYGVPNRGWQGNMDGHAVYGTPQYRACPKHFQAAEAQLKQDGYPDIAYWEA